MYCFQGSLLSNKFSKALLGVGIVMTIANGPLCKTVLTLPKGLILQLLGIIQPTLLLSQETLLKTTGNCLRDQVVEN